MSIRKRAGFILTALILLSCIGVCGCASASEPKQPADTLISYSNVPEAYWDMFAGGSFDENNVWITDDEQ